MAGRVEYGSLKNKDGKYVWWYVLWRLPNFLFEARGYFDDGERDGQARHVAQGRAFIGVAALVYVAYAYPGYLDGVQEFVPASGRLWPGVGTLMRFATTWETSIVNSLFLTTAWILLFAVLIIFMSRKDAWPGVLLGLRWPLAAVAMFGGLFWLAARYDAWVTSRYSAPGFAVAVVIIVVGLAAIIFLGKVIYLAATDVFRGDDAHPLLAPFVSTGVSWTLAYLALSSSGQSRIPGTIRLLVALLGPVSVTLINVWACQRIRRKHGGDLLFLDGPQGGSGHGPDPAGGTSGSSRREFLRLAVPPAVVLGTSPWWAPKALAQATSRSDQLVDYLTDTGPYANTSTNLEVSEAVVTSVAFSSDGRTLASASTYGTVQLWDTANPARTAALGHPITAQTEISSVAFSPSGHILATGRGNATVQLWNTADRTHPTALGHPLTAPNEVSSVAFSPDGHTLAATSNYSDGLDGTAPGAIQLWDLTHPARPRELSSSGSAAQQGYSSVAFSPDGRLLASGSMTGIIQLWDIADRTRPAVLSSLPTSASEGYTFTAFSPDGHLLAGGNSDGTVYLWDIADPARPAALGKPQSIPDAVSSIAFSPDGRTLAASSNRGWSSLGPYDGTGAICAWNITNPARPAGPALFPTAPVPGFSSIAFSPDGHILASGSDAGPNGNGPGSVQLWNIASPAHPSALGHTLG